MVEPDTVVRWHRSAWRAYWRWKSRRGPGRPHIPAEWQRLIVRIATEHPRCLDHVIAVNERHRRRVLGEYVQHYNAMRPHRHWRSTLRRDASRC